MVKQTVEQHKKALEKQLWNIANTLRGNVSADELRDYILGFIFYKYLSERMHQYADGILATDGIKFDSIDESTAQGQEYLEVIKEEAINHLGYFLKPSELFHVIAKKGANGEFIIESLVEVLNHIEQSTMGTASEDDFNGLFDDIDLTSNKLGKSEKDKNELISKVLGHLDEIDFCLNDTEINVLGDAYEYLIGQFASGTGKQKGDFYTPPMVSKLIAKLVTKGKTQLKSVYDPTCGSGSLLLQVAKEINRQGGEVNRYFGQEKNSSTYNLARMNMILRGVNYRDFDIQQDDTLENPRHIDQRFEAVVASPPFSAHWSANAEFLTDERFKDCGKLAPTSEADFAFVQHMLHHLDDNGTMAVILPHGVLYRGAAEGHIRKYLIAQKNCLDAVINLPVNIFYGTSISTCILVFKKNREHKDNIQFIDASNYFGKTTNQNYLRMEDIDKISNAYITRSQIDKFSYIAHISQIEALDFNLSIRRYVDGSPQSQYLESLKEQIEGYIPEIVFNHVIQSRSLNNENSDETGFNNAVLIPRGIGQEIVLVEAGRKTIKSGCFILVLNEQTLDAKYLALYLNSVVGQAYLKDCAELTSTIRYCTLDALKNYLLAPIPPLDIQKACIDVKNKIEELKEKISLFEKDIIFKPDVAKKVAYQLSSTVNFLDKVNAKEELLNLIRKGEDSLVEFKESFSWDLRRTQNDKKYRPKKEDHIETSSLKTIVGFLNASGGILFIGVADDKVIKGIKNEIDELHSGDCDNFLLHFKNKLKHKIGESFYPYIQTKIETLDEKLVLVIKCSGSQQPCFFDNETLYVRTNPATDALQGREMWDYLNNHFINKSYGINING
ncbi:MAG: type I restriction enzyme M protein [Oleiphilaceae bacterium]|jgi:type I restriction enzyme M protein